MLWIALFLASAGRGDLGYHYCHHPASRALSTAKTRATRAHLGGNCGLLLCRCHLHDRKLVPEVNYGGHHRHQTLIHRPGIYYSDNLPSAQGKSNTATNHLLQKSLQEIKGNPLNNECKMWKV